MGLYGSSRKAAAGTVTATFSTPGKSESVRNLSCGSVKYRWNTRHSMLAIRAMTVTDLILKARTRFCQDQLNQTLHLFGLLEARQPEVRTESELPRSEQHTARLVQAHGIMAPSGQGTILDLFSRTIDC